MVSVLPGARSPFDLIGEMTGNAINQSLPQAVQQGYNRGLLQKSLSEISNLAKQPNASNLDVMTKFLQATAGIPGSERYVGQVLPEILKQVEAARSQNYPIAGEQKQINNQTAQSLQSEPTQQLISNALKGAESSFFPKNIGPQGGPGQAPQAATTGQKLPLRTRAEKADAAKKHLAEMRKIDPAYNLQSAVSDIREEEEDKKLWNAEVDKELQQRKQAQIDYGQKAVDQLQKVYSDAPPEVVALFKKKGELASKRGESEADIERYLANESRKIKNTISNVKNDLSPARLQNILYRKLKGNYKDFNTAAKDLRVKLQPLIDEGLFDTSRNILEGLGYGPEERDVIINPLSAQSQSIVNQLPNYKPIKIGAGQFGVKASEKPTNYEDLKPLLKQIKEKENNFSLVLGRKAFEDKGYDWRLYNQAVKEMIQNGELELTDDQFNQLTYLDSPPLDALDEILQGLNIIGR